MHRDIIVIGCSLGGVEALPQLVVQLPKMDAAVFIVMHMWSTGRNPLLEILRNPLFDIRTATDGDRIKSGTLYLAVPDHHLLLDRDRVRLSRGPKESHARPSVDALFRSAAFAAGRRVIGIVLTGQLDDGTAGLWSVKDRGGVAIVQSPDEAAYPSMPRSALDHVEVDGIWRLDEMPTRLKTLTQEQLPPEGSDAMADERLKTEVGIALEDNALEQGVRDLGAPSFFTCPECHGSMVLIKEGPIRRFRCHTGHAFSEAALASHGLSAVESTLWSALAQLEEHYVLMQEVQGPMAEQSKETTDERSHRAQEVRSLMHRVRQLALDEAFRSKP
ncbi:MAG: chemotaxis protein CheB [Gammaproteobacteria bacterium]|nr:chemotaxis protein CheB [Gammaproteobacteria bacterium]